MKINEITIIDNNNYGNRLQNYAVQEFIKREMKCEIQTINNTPILNKKSNRIEEAGRIVKYIKVKLQEKLKRKTKRKKLFLEFNKKINITKRIFKIYKTKQYENNDFYIVGSDQVWNPKFSRLRDFDLLNFTNSRNKIAFSASFGISKLPEEEKEKTKKALKNFKQIAVREEAGKKIVEQLTGRTDIEVLVDPTMLLTNEEWDKVAKKPEQLNFSKYILNYFLGELSFQRKKEIERIAKENDCEIINILDKNSPFYQTGPSEFLYLEKNAFFICTDSFHSSVFAILYDRPFIIFEREDRTENMNSRIETLLSKFELQDRKFKGEIRKENLEHNYKKAYEILEKERIKARKFLKKALDIEEE